MSSSPTIEALHLSLWFTPILTLLVEYGGVHTKAAYDAILLFDYVKQPRAHKVIQGPPGPDLGAGTCPGPPHFGGPHNFFIELNVPNVLTYRLIHP